jgi:hypothetical protein
VKRKIDIDLDRTRMDEMGHSEEYQRSLAQTLTAFAVFDTETGYVQGINFLANVLLTYLTPMVRRMPSF